MMRKAKCELCDADIPIPDDAVVGEVISCPECSSEFEITKITEKEIQLREAEKIEEDWGE
jgi:alpha-aminoadipate carrier protein LysW